jgi:hypothetical protein
VKHLALDADISKRLAPGIFTPALRGSTIDSSSDFLIALTETFRKSRPKDEYLPTLEFIYDWEYSNWSDSTEKNLAHIEKKLDGLMQWEYDMILSAYDIALDFFLNHCSCMNFFRLDSVDEVGNTIYEQLTKKRLLVIKYKAIATYLETKND